MCEDIECVRVTAAEACLGYLLLFTREDMDLQVTRSELLLVFIACEFKQTIALSRPCIE